jgi:CheY-like chemotaxis protein
MRDAQRSFILEATMTWRVLIVDDNARFLDAARGLLEREGMSVVAVASSGAEALRRIHELRPDVTLLDVDLGDVSGFDVARQIAAATGRGRSPVILISAYPEQDLVELIAQSPAIGFLAKSDLSAAAISGLLGTAPDRRSGPV